jgi:hypothetical protein
LSKTVRWSNGGQVGEGAVIEGAHGVVEGGRGRHDDDLCVRIEGLHLL